MSVDVDEKVDLSDLDLLDDKHRHARCTFCGPAHIGLGVPFIALCGVKAVYLNQPDDPHHPSDACADCEELWHQPCARCGH